MRLLILILLAIILLLLVISAMLAGAIGIAHVLRWAWPAIDPGSATIVGLMALLVTIQLAKRLISLASREETEADEDEDKGDEDVDVEEARRIRRVMWRVRPDTEAYIPKRRRRRRRD
jgi:hypothetical protein